MSLLNCLEFSTTDSYAPQKSQKFLRFQSQCFPPLTVIMTQIYKVRVPVMSVYSQQLVTECWRQQTDAAVGRKAEDQLAAELEPIPLETVPVTLKHPEQREEKVQDEVLIRLLK